MNVSFSDFAKPNGGAYVVGAFEGGALSNQAKSADKQTRGRLKKAIAASGRFTGAKGQMLEVLAPSGLKVQRLILVGLGKAEAFDGLRAEEIGGTITAYLLTTEKLLTFAIDQQKGMKVDAGEIAARIAFGARLRSYRFDQYRTQLKKEQRPSLTKIVVMTDDVAGARRTYRSFEAIGDAITFTRDLVSEPANVLYPEEFSGAARRSKNMASPWKCLAKRPWRN